MVCSRDERGHHAWWLRDGGNHLGGIAARPCENRKNKPASWLSLASCLLCDCFLSYLPTMIIPTRLWWSHQPSPESSTFAATMLSNLHSCELNKLLLLNTQSRAFCSSYGDQTVIQEMYCWSARPAILELCCTSLLWNWAQKKMFLCFRGKIQDFLREKVDKRTLGLIATLGSVHWQSNQSRSQECSSYSPYILSCCTK